jgi:hypothetical protein
VESISAANALQILVECQLRCPTMEPTIFEVNRAGPRSGVGTLNSLAMQFPRVNKNAEMGRLLGQSRDECKLRLRPSIASGGEMQMPERRGRIV